MNTSRKTIWTIGHSTLKIDEFSKILAAFDIKIIADIRGLPGSTRYPHFNKENLEATLSEINIKYFHLKNLGGRRKTRKDSKNLGWRNESFRGYADYMETEDFINAVNELEKIAVENRVALMCAEVLWCRFHRSIIADYLKLNGWKVIHIMSITKAEEHSYTQPARIIQGKLKYTRE